jgi:hypothetical protein
MSQNTQDNKKTLTIVAIVVAVLLIGGYLYMQKNKGLDAGVTTPAETTGEAPVEGTTGQ